MEHNWNETLHQIRFIAEVDIAGRTAKNLSPEPSSSQPLTPDSKHRYAQSKSVTEEIPVTSSPSRSFHSRIYVR